MSSTRIFYNTFPRPSFWSLFGTLWFTYEISRLATGTHPLFRRQNPNPQTDSSPSINSSSASSNPDNPSALSTLLQNRPAAEATRTPEQRTIDEAAKRRVDARRAEARDKRRSLDEKQSTEGWVVLNGVPIPRFEMLIRPFVRRE